MKVDALCLGGPRDGELESVDPRYELLYCPLPMEIETLLREDTILIERQILRIGVYKLFRFVRGKYRGPHSLVYRLIYMGEKE